MRSKKSNRTSRRRRRRSRTRSSRKGARILRRRTYRSSTKYDASLDLKADQLVAHKTSFGTVRELFMYRFYGKHQGVENSTLHSFATTVSEHHLSSLIELDFSFNRYLYLRPQLSPPEFRLEDFQALAGVFQYMPELKKLNLDSMKIDDDGIAALAPHFPVTLTDLRLEDNAISDVGILVRNLHRLRALKNLNIGSNAFMEVDFSDVTFPDTLNIVISLGIPVTNVPDNIIISRI